MNMGDKNLETGRGVVGGFFPLPKQAFFSLILTFNQFYMELQTTTPVSFPSILALPGAAGPAGSDPAGPHKRRPGPAQPRASGTAGRRQREGAAVLHFVLPAAEGARAPNTRDSVRRGWQRKKGVYSSFDDK